MLLNTSVGTSQLVFRICTLHWQYLAFSFDGWCGVRKARACCRIGIKARMVAKARSAFALLARLPHCISKRTLCKRTRQRGRGRGISIRRGRGGGGGRGRGRRDGRLRYRVPFAATTLFVPRDDRHACNWHRTQRRSLSPQL